MCDGSVRFFKDDISDDVFKALCTIKGGEEIPDLNQSAPKVDKKASLKTASGEMLWVMMNGDRNVVVRDAKGGVAWRVWTIRAE